MSARQDRRQQPATSDCYRNIAIILDIPDWMTHGLCNEVGDGDGIFFPERGHKGEEAKQVCKGCFVREERLEFALENGERGVWGGTTEADRRRMKREVAA